MSAFVRICCSFALAHLIQVQQMQPHEATDSATCAPSLVQMCVDGRRKAVNKVNQEVSALYNMLDLWESLKPWNHVPGFAKSSMPNIAALEP